MIALLDVNFLIALGDADHVHSEAALRFFSDHALRSGWATCPLTENAFLRIFGHPNYEGGPGNAAAARRVLLSIITNSGHQFWPDDISLANPKTYPELPPPKGLTDIYLLALATKKRGRFVTFDRRIDPSLVPGGPTAFHLLQSS